ncbi:hypothetical protein CHARACLAT_013533 [Characodon lateralis]|uniref:Uncharacterized protein n=1 Tax=Characodon lateralis TaxID=208331 RepID=A0ABU7CMW9_9TELE|nr:hypothetical protein [Characodon lateralis]
MADSGNQSCLMEAQDTVSFLVCLFHVWEEWAGLDQLEDYLSFLEYLLWVFTPLAVVFLVPFLIVILLYLSILFLHVYKPLGPGRPGESHGLPRPAEKHSPSMCPGSSSGPPPGGTYPEHLTREAPKRHPNQMPEPLAPLDVEKQRLYSESLPDDRASHPISKGEHRHPAE